MPTKKELQNDISEMTKKLLHCETENSKLHIALKDKWGECEYTKEQNEELKEMIEATILVRRRQKRENEELKKEFQIGEVGNHERMFFIETTTKLEEEKEKLELENLKLKGRLNDNEKEAMIALDMAYEKRKKLEKENQQLKREIYEIVGEEGVILGQTGFINDSNEVELKEWVELVDEGEKD